MLSHDVVRSASNLRKSFETAKPFKHLCVENFFRPEVARALVRDFPTFDRARAVNEFGAVGGKAARPDLANISPFYSELFSYLGSDEFLSTMSALTGIEGLMHDPLMFGGGTHENLHGQELDPHVDFNFNGTLKLHRRVNALIYLNEEWDETWGGSIEIHSNPRRPDQNTIKSFSPAFNRCVIFETNEHSWHGFPKIQLPEGKRSLSRKCLSVYLYTKERPAAEIAPPHGTFYIQRPLPDRFKPGHVLTTEDVDQIKVLLRRRDDWIESYQSKELRDSKALVDNAAYIRQLLGRLRLPVTGYMLQRGAAQGAFADGWVSRNLTVEFEPQLPVTDLVISGWLPEMIPLAAAVVRIDGHLVAEEPLRHGVFELAVSLEQPMSRVFRLEVGYDASHNPKQAGESGDDRDLSYQLRNIRAGHGLLPTARAAK